MIAHVGDEELLAQTRRLIAEPPDVVVITTGIGLRGWLESADAAGLVEDLLAVLSGARLVARGPKARGALQAAGLTADWVAESETSEEIRTGLLQDGVVGQRIAIQHHGAGDDGLSSAFRRAGADVLDLVIYRWGPPPDPAAVRAAVTATAAGKADAVVFTSAPGAARWVEVATELGVLPDLAERVDDGLLLACVGPVTAAPLQAAGLRTVMPDRYRLGALIRELVARVEATGNRHGPPPQPEAGRSQVQL